MDEARREKSKAEDYPKAVAIIFSSLISLLPVSEKEQNHVPRCSYLVCST
jgi:hypothetical protein